MTPRRIDYRVSELLARRLEARAADQGVDLLAVVDREVKGWLGEWGASSVTHIVRPRETLSTIAAKYYDNASKSGVIAAYNGLDDSAQVHVGQVLHIPEAGRTDPLPPGESPYLFGLHDRGGEHYMGWAGRKGWVLATEALGRDPDEWSTQSYADLADGGYGVMVRLNHGYHEAGTLPRSEHYASFARRCGNFVEGSEGCHIWVIANEPNLAVERPGGPEHGEPITPRMYARAYALCRDQIHSRSGHEHDQVVTAAVGPWNIQTPYAGNASGDWVVYFRDMLDALDGELDGMAIHTYGRSPDPAEIVSELRMNPPYEARRKMFRTYQDFLEAVPAELRGLPAYLTETDQNVPWLDVNRGWVAQAYAEIDRWNADITRQRIRAMILYRWERYAGDQWYIRGKNGVINDFRAALQNEYRWYG